LDGKLNMTKKQEDSKALSSRKPHMLTNSNKQQLNELTKMLYIM